MDERLRQLERAYLIERSSAALSHLLNRYLSSMSVPEADIRILALLHSEVGFKPRGRKGGIAHWLEPEQLAELYERGYNAGIYFVTKNPAEDDAEVVKILVHLLKRANRNMANDLGNYDSVDWIETAPINAMARGQLPSGLARWQDNQIRLRDALLIKDEEWSEIHALLASYYRKIYRGKKSTVYGRYFIPAWILEACFALPVNAYNQGYSRRFIYRRTASTIDFQSEGKVAELRKRLYDLITQTPVWLVDVDEITASASPASNPLGTSPKDFGLNLFLSIDSATRRSLKNRWEQELGD